MTDNWDSYFCLVEDRPASMLIDLGLALDAPLAAYPVSAYVGIFVRHPDRQGFPSQEEYESLTSLEDAFAAAAASAGFWPTGSSQPSPQSNVPGALPDLLPPKTLAHPGGIYAGRCLTNGRCTLFFYLPTSFGGATLENRGLEGSDSWGSRVEPIMAAFPDYIWEAGAEEDQDWSIYREFLFPDAYALLSIQNARLKRRLAEAGDSASMSRRIEHWALLPDPIQAEGFYAVLQELGFTPAGLELPENDKGLQRAFSPSVLPDSVQESTELFATVNGKQAQEYPLNFSVRAHFFRIDPLDSIDEVTWLLWDAAADQGGSYQGWASPVVLQTGMPEREPAQM